MRKVFIALLIFAVFSSVINIFVGNSNDKPDEHEISLTSNHENLSVDYSTFDEVDNRQHKKITKEVFEKPQLHTKLEGDTTPDVSTVAKAVPRIPSFRFRELFSSDISDKLLAMQDKVSNGEHQINTAIVNYINSLQTEMFMEVGGIYSEDSKKLFQSQEWDALYKANIFHAIQGCRTQSAELCYVNVAHISLGIEFSNPEDFYSWKIASREFASFWVGFPVEDWHLKESYPQDYIPEDQMEQAINRAEVIKAAMAAQEWDFSDFSQAYWVND